ncbi:HWE histidine kinase domain-containing protein [Aureimonas endophytica]|uniref:HWE histidine kinase domain-containing protein n=1 Tax=Aureimonas endophytica TaxID=2027858 RepID=UPI003570D997
MQDEREERRIQSELAGLSDGSDPFAAAVRSTRMPMLITNPRLPDNPIIFCNDAFEKLTGYRREEIFGRNCRFLQGPGTNREDVARLRRAVADLVPIEIDLLNYKKNGETFWNRLLVSPVFDGGEPTYFFASQYDVTPERERLQRLELDQATLESEIRRRIVDLTESEERLRFALHAGRLGAWTLDLVTMRFVASNICKEIFGRRAAEGFAYEDLRAAIQGDDRARWDAAVAEADGGDLDVEFRIATPAGDTRWVEIRGRTSLDAEGKRLSMGGVSLDITERKRAEEHRILLVRELNHRVKNTLATVQSIVRQSLRSGRSVQEAGDAADARIRALSAAHDVLTDESWSGASMRDIVERTLRPFIDESRERIRLDGEAVRLPPRPALAISMALHELATNAVKHGALSSETGTVALRWSAGGSGEPARLRLHWEEAGGPPVTPPEQRGFGTRLIERALASEIGGEAKLDYRPSGLVFTVDAPMDGLMQSES